MEDSAQALFYSLFLNVTGDETEETNMIFTERADAASQASFSIIRPIIKDDELNAKGNYTNLHH